MTAAEPKFYIELPADKYGNTGRARAVVEASVIQDGPHQRMIPVAPPHFTGKWPGGWYTDIYGGYAEVEGPARMLSDDEYDALIKQVRETAGEQR